MLPCSVVLGFSNQFESWTYTRSTFNIPVRRRFWESYNFNVILQSPDFQRIFLPSHFLFFSCFYPICYIDAFLFAFFFSSLLAERNFGIKYIGYVRFGTNKVRYIISNESLHFTVHIHFTLVESIKRFVGNSMAVE